MEEVERARQTLLRAGYAVPTLRASKRELAAQLWCDELDTRLETLLGWRERDGASWCLDLGGYDVLYGRQLVGFRLQARYPLSDGLGHWGMAFAAGGLSVEYVAPRLATAVRLHIQPDFVVPEDARLYRWFIGAPLWMCAPDDPFWPAVGALSMAGV